MDLLHQNLSRFAVFSVESDAEALDVLRRATAGMYETPPVFQGFTEEGLLVGLEAGGDDDREEDSGRPLFMGRAADELYEDETIQIARFEGGVNLLTIELYDEAADPNQPLNADNIVLARRLELLANAKTK